MGIERNRGTGTLSGMPVSNIATGASAVFGSAQQGVDQLADIYRRRELARDQSWASNEISLLSDSVDERFQEAMRDAAEDGSDLLELYDNVWQEAYAEAAERAPSGHARSALGDKAVRFNAQARQRVRAQAAGMEAGYMVGEISKKISRSSVDIYNSPDTLQYHLEEIDEDIAKHREYGAISDAALTQLSTETRAKYAEAAINGTIQQDPAAALAALEGGEYDDLLGDADRKNVMVARAKSAVSSRASAAATAIKGLARDAQAAIYAGDGDQLRAGELARMVDMLEGTSEGADLARAMQFSAPLAAIKKLPAHELQEILSAADTQKDVPVAALEYRKAAKAVAERTLSEMGDSKEGLNAFSEAIYGQAPDPLFATVNLPTGQAQKVLDTQSEDWSRRVSDRYTLWRQAMEHTSNPSLLPFTPPEMALIEQSLKETDTLGEDAMVRTMDALGFSDLQPHELNQIASALGENNPTLGVAVAHARTNPDLASQIMQGADRIKEVKFGANDFRLPDDFVAAHALNRKGMYATEKAARALYALRYDPSDENFQSEVWERALNDASGGAPIEWRNGSVLLPPTPDTTPAQFDTIMRRLTDDDLRKYGAYVNGYGQESRLDGPPVIDPDTEGLASAPLTIADVLDEGALLSVAPGRYIVTVGTGAVKRSAQGGMDEVYLLDLGAWVRDNGIPVAPARSAASPLRREPGELPVPRL